MSDNVKGYEIKRAIVFENDRGFALGENPQVHIESHSIMQVISYDLIYGDPQLIGNLRNLINRKSDLSPKPAGPK